LGQSSFASELKKILGRSGIYSIGSVFDRGIVFLLLPIYTRYLTPADYGIMSFIGAITGVLAIIYPLGLTSSITRLYYSESNEIARRRTLGTIWLTIFITALGLSILLDLFRKDIFNLFVTDDYLNPYIRISIWISFFAVFSGFPLTLYQIQGKSFSYACISITKTVLTIGLIIGFVVFLKQGIHGYFKGTLIALILLSIPYTYISLRNLEISFLWQKLKLALHFGLPLLPHSITSWVLALSDRIIIQRFIAISELGIYSLGYQLSGIVMMFATAINYAWMPFFFRTIEQSDEYAHKNIARMSTYYILALCIIALACSLFMKEIIMLLTISAYHLAYKVTPIIIGANLLSALYFIPGNFLYLKKKTVWLIPVITIISGAINILINIIYVPKYGIMAAAWATLFAYGIMCVLNWFFVIVIYRFPFEYERLFKIFLMFIILFAVGYHITIESIALAILLKTVLILIFFMTLIVAGFFTPSEKEKIQFLYQDQLANIRKIINKIKIS